MTKSVFVHDLAYDRAAVGDWLKSLEEPGEADARRHFLDFPTVYIVQQEEGAKYDVYVGETSDIRQRTTTHIVQDARHREDWGALANAKNARMMVVGHRLFNKSLTLDVENRLMLWLSGVDKVGRLHNRRTNQQNDYYTREQFDTVFSQIWRELRRHNQDLFPTERLIRDSALFKASPFHKLTAEQLEAKYQVLERIEVALARPQAGQLILLSGAAGTGKTVLLSSLFYELAHGDDPQAAQEGAERTEGHADTFLLVNHNEQLTVYEQLAKKLGLGVDHVSKPTSFINKRAGKPIADVILVDEAHLLWTQGKQSYRGQHMMKDLLGLAKVVVAVYDPQQAIATNQYWDDSARAWLREATTETIQLRNQMRMRASDASYHWIRDVIDTGHVNPLPPDDDYRIEVFETPEALHEAIRAKERKANNQGLSRLVATYDWEFHSNRRREDGGDWTVDVADFRVPWNYQLPKERALVDYSWAEQPQTIEECGSHFTVQGFDLNYVGVILGPSVTYRDGVIIRDPSKSANRQATQKRTTSDGFRRDVSLEMLRNELNILLTRGVHGLYLFAVDPELQQALLEAQAARQNGSGIHGV